MSDLYLDVKDMKQIYLDLLNASVQFGQIDSISKNVADAVGHDGLEGKVRDFATKWDDRRSKIIESIDAVGGSALAIGKAFGELDLLLGNALEGKA